MTVSEKLGWKEPSEGHPAQLPAESKADYTDQVAQSTGCALFVTMWISGIIPGLSKLLWHLSPEMF